MTANRENYRNEPETEQVAPDDSNFIDHYEDDVQWHDFDDFPHEDYDFYEELPDDVEQELALFEANPFARDE